MRPTGLLSLAIMALVAIATDAHEAGAQRSARAPVSVVVVPPAIPFTTVDSVLARAAADSTPALARLRFSGARVVSRDRSMPSPASRTSVAPVDRPRVLRTITLEYVAN